MKLYVMMDRVSGVFGNVFEDHNDAAVKRAFKNVVDSGSIPRHVALDTVVFCLGDFIQDSTQPHIDSCIPYVVLRGDEYEYSGACEAASAAPDCVGCNETV